MGREITVYTVGHSTRSLEQFVALLKGNGVRCLVDVRTVPRSRHNPQFSIEVLEEALPQAGVRYLHLKGLGGLRHPRADSPNLGWHNLSFRGYADYMQTEEFADALALLLKVATEEQVAIMCAEAVPWRCHRSLIGDALLVAGAQVLDIMNEKHVTAHKLSPMAKVVEGRITYPGDAAAGAE